MFEEATAAGREDRRTSDASGASAKRVTLDLSISLYYVPIFGYEEGSQKRAWRSLNAISPKPTSGPGRRKSVLAHAFRVARGLGMILWTAKRPSRQRGQPPSCQRCRLRRSKILPTDPAPDLGRRISR